MPKGRRFWFDVAKLAIWTAAILLFFRFLGYLVGGNFREFWLIIAVASIIFITFMIVVLKNFRLPGDAADISLPLNGGTDESPSNPLITKDTTAMAKNENPSFTFSQPVTINASTNHNAPGGIIGNAPITIIQHFDKSQPVSPTIDTEILEEAAAVPRAKMASLDELCDYAETLLGGAIAENTIRNLLERNAIESCGEEERGRARAKLFPREQAEKVIADYVNIRKRK